VLKCVHEDLKEVKDISLIKVVYTKEYTEALLKELEGQKDPYTPIIEFLLNIHTLPIEYQYGIDTSPQQEQAQAKAEEQKETKEQTKAEVISTSKFTYKNLITNSFEEKDLSKDFDNIL
jgi:4-alpha-glucanotransferase